METLLNEINDLLKSKNETIANLKWKVGYLEKENEKLTKENDDLDRDYVEICKRNAELRNDIAKYEENEVNRV